MAKKEKTPDDRPPITDEQISDILLVMDKKELSVRVASDIDKNGKTDTVPAEKEHENDFMKVDYSCNILTNFISNFWNQAKDPTRFRLFRSNTQRLEKDKKVLNDILKGKETPATKEFLEKYEIKPKETAQNKDIKNSNNSNNNKEENKMAKQQQEQKTTGNGENTPKPPRYNESMINWDELKKFGVSRDDLEKKGLLDGMLKGYKTNELIPISMNFGSAILRADARLSFQQTKEGQVVLAMHGVRKEPNLERPYFGHIFSEEDKKNLRESGNMGRVVDLTSQSGQRFPSLISIDKLTNEVVSMRAENLFLSKDVKGVTLTNEELNNLKEGKKIYVEGMISPKGSTYNAHLQVNADRRGIEFLFENDKIFNRQEIGGVPLSQKNIDTLNDGKAILLEDMKRKDGGTFDSYVHLDPSSGKAVFTKFDPFSPEDNRSIIIPKELGGVPLTEEDRSDLRQGKPIYVADMQSGQGDPYTRFVKLCLETGRAMYSKTPDGFDERPQYKVPDKIWDVPLNTTQRAMLQEGKATEVKGMKAFDGSEVGPFVKVNLHQGKLEFYNKNPDLDKTASQRNVVAEKQAEKQKKQDKKGDDNTEKVSKKKTRSVA